MDVIKKTVLPGLAVVVAVMFLPAGVQAEETPVRGPVKFSTFDKDGNGLISEEEFNSVRGQRMSGKAGVGRWQHGATGENPFSMFDTNADGQLTRSELAAGRELRREKRGNPEKARRAGMGQGEGAGMGKNRPAFSEFDLDGDGKIAEKEFNEARSKRISERAKQGYQMKNIGYAPSFSDIDKNGDGSINSEEFATHQSQHRQQKAQ